MSSSTTPRSVLKGRFGRGDWSGSSSSTHRRTGTVKFRTSLVSCAMATRPKRNQVYLTEGLGRSPNKVDLAVKRCVWTAGVSKS